MVGEDIIFTLLTLSRLWFISSTSIS